MLIFLLSLTVVQALIFGQISPPPRNTPTPSTFAKITIPSKKVSDCSCGYILTAQNNTYFPYHKTFDFSKITSNTALKASGWIIKTGGVGGKTREGIQCQGKEENIRYANGAMSLVVPANEYSGAEIVFNQTITGGVITMDAQIDSTIGTCQALFTYSADDKYGDEQDIEVVGANLNTLGIQTTNWDTSSGMEETNRLYSSGEPNKAGVDIYSAFHTYTIGWLPGGTKYSFDGQPLSSPAKFSSVNPSTIRIDHWTNGSPYFTQGPPTKDTSFKIRKIDMYYTTGSGLPSGCTIAKACKV